MFEAPYLDIITCSSLINTHSYRAKSRVSRNALLQQSYYSIEIWVSKTKPALTTEIAKIQIQLDFPYFVMLVHIANFESQPCTSSTTRGSGWKVLLNRLTTYLSQPCTSWGSPRAIKYIDLCILICANKYTVIG